MRWEDERYVRLYTRDTPDWLCLSFLAQGLFCLLLRKVDRAGVLPLGKAGRKGVAVAVGHAHEWPKLEAALDELLADGCLRIEDDHLVVPNFLEAQEALQSDRARARKHREKARDLRLNRVTVEEQPVTERHAGPEQRDGSDTPRDADATACDQTVTPSRTVPSRTVPNQPNQPSMLADGTDRGSAAATTTVTVAPARPPAKNGSEGPERPLLVVDLDEIHDEEGATAKAELEARLRAGYGHGYEKALRVAAKAFHRETVAAWVEAVHRCGRAVVVDACYDAAGDYWRRKAEPVESLRWFLDTLKRLRPGSATP